jgi:dTDP-4-dehydrorhamnose 3,5-epimerase
MTMNQTALPFVSPDRPEGLIRDVVIRPLRVNRDPRGTLVESLKQSWSDLYHPTDRPFAQHYFSTTLPGVARDEDRWHVHEHQEDRFSVVIGDIVVAIYDPRPDSPTRGQINLFRLGESNGDEGQFAVLVPRRCYHGFVAVGATPAILQNFPTREYDPADEGRVPFAEAGAALPDGTIFTWDLLRAP